MREVDVANAVYAELFAIVERGLVPTRIGLGAREYRAARKPRSMFGLPVYLTGHDEGVRIQSKSADG